MLLHKPQHRACLSVCLSVLAEKPWQEEENHYLKTCFFSPSSPFLTQLVEKEGRSREREKVAICKCWTWSVYHAELLDVRTAK